MLSEKKARRISLETPHELAETATQNREVSRRHFGGELAAVGVLSSQTKKATPPSWERTSG